jgi:hypothetical protein
MADVQTVVIEFVTNDEQLDSAINKLEKTGAVDSQLANAFKQTTSEISKQSNEIKKAAASTAPLKKSLDDVNKATKSFTQDFMTGFNEGVIETLKEAGVTVEQFTEALKTGQTEVQEPTESLRQRLKNLTQQIAEMKLAGDDGTDAFQKLVVEAGNIKDAMADAGAEIRNAGSDTRTFDNLLGSAQAVAGGFAVAQGAVALFGEENKDLEKTMLKVNAAIAITQGLQSISAALEKEGALSLLATNIQLKVKNAQKVIENGLESTSIVVRGGAIIAQKALNAAMAANPIGIVVVALAGLITLLGTYGRSAAAARQQTTNLNVALGQGAKGYEARIEAAKRTEEAEIAGLENVGATDSKIAEKRLENERKIANITKERLEELRQAKANNAEADLEKRKQVDEEISRLEDQATTDILFLSNLEVQQKKKLREEDLKNTIAGLEVQLSKAEEGSKNQLNIQKRLIAARTALELNADGLLANERAAIAERGRQAEAEAVAAANKRDIDNQLKAIDTKLINVKEGSEEELNLKKQQIELQTQSELSNTKLSEDEKIKIKENGFARLRKLQTDYNNQVRREAIEDQISRNEAEIQLLKTNDEAKLILQIANIELAAAAEVDAAKGNSAKIKEINAKRDADILGVRKKFIEDAAQYEIDIRIADNGPATRALQRIIADERKAFIARKSAIKQLADFQVSNIDIQLKALEDEKEKKLISEKDYILKYKQLQDKKREITEESEKATTDLIKAETIERIDIAINVTNQLLDLFQSISDTQSQKENDRIEGERQRVAELLEAGAITEREAAARNKRIDAEEKKAKAQQAQREKTIAVFRAFLAIPQAFLQGLAQGGPVLGAIYAAIAAAQAVIVAARPLPRFGHGKKSGYEGPAEIGETGPELYEQNGRMFLADKKQIVWLSAKDKVYNPTETKQMLLPEVDKQIMQWQPAPQNQTEIDYDKLGKAVGKHVNIPGFNIDEEGFKIWEQKGLERKNYMDKRYSSK